MFLLPRTRLISPVVLHRTPLVSPKYRCPWTLKTSLRPLNHEESKSYSTDSDPPRNKRKWFSKWVLIPAALLLPSSYLYSQAKSNEDSMGALEDTEQLYKSKSTTELAFSLFILKLCSFSLVVDYGPKLLDFAKSYHLSVPALWVIKHTFFRNFVPGETLDECMAAADVLKKNNIGVIFDYSIETGSGTKEDLDKAADHFIETLNVASHNPSLAFGCVKVSGLASFTLLDRVTQLVQYYNAHNIGDLPLDLELQAPKKRTSVTYKRPLPAAPAQAVPPPPLSPQEAQELREFMQRFDKLCGIAAKLNVPLLVDAEQTYYQPAIDLFTLHMCKKYNQTNSIIYNTYQMYLKGSTERLLTDIAQANKQGYHLGVKLVRGAYMYGERDRAAKFKYEDPIHPSIEDTHKSYYNGVDISLNNLGRVGVMIASHNEETIVSTLEKVRQMKIDPKDPNLQFAQLYGMADHLTLLTVHNGQRAFKYVPFGPVEFVMPYLIRRMQENRGFIGSTSAKERTLLWRELVRRVGTWSPTHPHPQPPSLPTNVGGKVAT